MNSPGAGMSMKNRLAISSSSHRSEHWHGLGHDADWNAQQQPRISGDEIAVVTRWDEKAGLRRDAVRSQVIDALEAQDKKETGNEARVAPQRRGRAEIFLSRD